MKKASGVFTLVLLLASGCVRFHPEPLSTATTAEALEHRSLSDPELLRFIQKNLPGDWAVSNAASWHFDALFLAAIYFHPDMELARAHWQVSGAEIKTAGARPNPTVSVVPEYDFTPTSGVSPWLPAITFDQPIETAGKRGYRIARSRHLAEAARFSMAAEAWQVRSRLHSSLLQLAAARRREALQQTQVSTQEQLLNLLRQRVQAGAIAGNELGPAQLALAKTRLDQIDARRQKAEALAAVAEAIGISTRALKETELSFDLADLSQVSRELLSTELRREALRSRADVLSTLAEYDASQSALQLEIAKQYPDIHIGTGYQWDQGENKWQLGVTAEIPVLNRNEGPIAEAQAHRREAAVKLLAVQAKVIADLDRAIESFEAAERDLAALREQAALQQTQREAVENQVRAGAADRVDLLNAQVDFQTGELTRLEVLIKANEAFANLENAVQRPVDMPGVDLEKSIEADARRNSKDHDLAH